MKLISVTWHLQYVLIRAHSHFLSSEVSDLSQLITTEGFAVCLPETNPPPPTALSNLHLSLHHYNQYGTLERHSVP